MSSSSSTSSSDDELSSKPIKDEVSLASITLTESNGNGSVDVNNDLAWGRKSSAVEVEADGSSSASSSGYAGERGSSETSNSRIDEDEIQEVNNDGGFGDGVHDSRAAWVPGKRHVDEVSL